MEGGVVLIEVSEDVAGRLDAIAAREQRSTGEVLDRAIGRFLDAQGWPAASTAGWPGLTEREAEVASLLSRGYRSTEIGPLLGIDPKTVDTHRGNALKKLGLRDNAALIRYAIREGLVSVDADADAPGCSRQRGPAS